MRRIRLILILMSAILAGCKNQSLQAPAIKAASLVGSTNASAELLEEATGNVFALIVEGARVSSDFTQAQITSVCALAFYNELNESERSDNCYVRVLIQPEKGKAFQATYSGEELAIADRCIENASAFFRWHPTMGLDSIRFAVDPLFFPDSLLERIGQSILVQDSADNGWIRTEIMGFRQDTVSNIPVMVLYAKAVRKQQAQWYDAYARYSGQKLLFVAAQLKND